MLRIPVLLFAVLACVLPAPAQGPGRMAVRSFRAADGLPDATVNSLFQDRLGRYWAAGELGLFVGDGTTFLKVPVDSRELRPSFKAVLEDAAGELYALSEGGLWRLDGGRMRLVPLPLPPRTQGLPPQLVRDGAAQLWLLWNQDLHRLGASTRLEPRALPGRGEARISPRLGAGLLLRRGLATWKAEGEAWVPLPNLPLRPGEAPVNTLAEDRGGTLWAATSQRLLRLPPGAGAWQTAPEPGPEQGYSGGVCTPLPGEVWGMGDQVAHRLDREEPPLETTSTFPTFAMRLLLRDREGNLWADRNGLHRVGGPWRAYGGLRDLPVLGAWQALRDPLGRLWLSSTAGLFRGTPTGWERAWTGRIHSQIALGADGLVWATDRTSGRILRFDPRAARPHPLPLPPDLAGVEAIRGVSAAGDRLAFATRSRGILLGRWSGGRWHWTDQPGHADPLALRTFADPAGRLHLLSRDEQGAALHAFPEGPWRPLPAELGPQPTDFLSWSPDTMLGVRYSPAELHTLQLQDGVWKSVGRLDLARYSPCTVAYGVRPLGPTRLWVLTDHGILELDRAHPERARHFTSTEGMPFDDCNQFGLLVEPDRIWVSTGTGLASYERREEGPLPDLPDPLLLGFRRGEEPWSLDLPTTFAPGTRSLQFQFGLASPGRASHVRLFWMDPTREEAWREFQGPTLTFLDPAPGPHELRIRGLEPGGKPSPEWRTRFEILRPWWRRPWALGLWALLGGGLAYLFHRLRLKRIETRNLELAHLVARRTEDLTASEARERAASQAKSVFLANMSHELRTPLNAILLYSELIHGDAEEAGNQDLARDSTRILSSGRHLLSLINGILDLSKIEAGKMSLDLEAVPLRRLFEDVRATLAPLAAQRENALDLDLLPGEPSLRTDALKLKQVLLNLVGNAVKFTERGHVTLAARLEGDHCRIEVRDTGVGLTPEQIDRIFQAYEQGDRTAMAKAGGTGLGLTISHRFITLMGGRIEVESQPGRGTTFRVVLPAPPPPPPTPEPERPAPAR